MRAAPKRPAATAAVVATFPWLLAGCHPAFLGNLVVLGLTVGIFVATLSLGRTAGTTRADASTATRSTTARPS